jgi:hypothetical protein
LQNSGLRLSAPVPQSLSIQDARLVVRLGLPLRRVTITLARPDSPPTLSHPLSSSSSSSSSSYTRLGSSSQPTTEFPAVLVALLPRTCLRRVGRYSEATPPGSSFPRYQARLGPFPDLSLPVARLPLTLSRHSRIPYSISPTASTHTHSLSFNHHHHHHHHTTTPPPRPVHRSALSWELARPLVCLSLHQSVFLWKPLV